MERILALTLFACTVAHASPTAVPESCDLAAPDASMAGSAACVREWMDASLRINDIAAIGTHNSYKQHLPEAELAALVTQRGRDALGLDYGHPPLKEQLDSGARQLELDIYPDPSGGRYARTAAMKRPGFKVMHLPDVDHRSSCLTFVACLSEVRSWSQAHSNHVPILILINAKDGDARPARGAAPLPFDNAAFDALDAEIRSVFPETHLITPDQVRGSHATLREGVLAGGWPPLREARGKVFFALDETPEKVALYRGARQSLEGRLMFVNTDEASPAAAYLTLNDPIEQWQRIAAAVRTGFIVRTRADADTWAARNADVSQRTAALSSGAQYISTDYMEPEPRFGNTYAVHFAGADIAICNPQRSPQRCARRAIEMSTETPETGYLAPSERPDLVRILAPPPAPGSALALADIATFKATRELKDTARWSLATADVTGDMFDHFAEAVGVHLSARSAPVLAALLERSGYDRSVVSQAKTHFATTRPYLGTDAPICEPKTAHLAGDPDYPSGHAAHGAHAALILAELAPSRMNEILARGREYAESRYICGSHTRSAAEAGMHSGAMIYTAEHSSAVFRRDMETARAEVAAALAAADSIVSSR